MLSEKPYEVPPYLLRKCKGKPPVRTAVAGADHPVAMESARQAVSLGLIEPVFVGDQSSVLALAASMGWDISGYRIVHAPGDAKAPAAAVALARGHEVAALMKGQVHTDALMAAVVNRASGLRTSRRLSHIFHMTVPGRERVLMITDGAVNIHPHTDAKLHITQNAVDLAHALGNTNPKVALLSGTESLIDAMPSSTDAAEVVRRANNGEVTGATIDGPFAFDNAISPAAARLKGVDSPVAGYADILVVPNIETGNGLFKMMAYFMSATAAGIVMGAQVPIMLTSRADPPEARVASAALAAIVANHT
ncbi:MAG: bifunctional enoyl-CoA hydratase/phosphate acetyltransferase [Rhodospirillales bacterium]|nr:bifunctional enoyl-CoA hydratase/phosphate acetyltransferase [Rhodospirillales bacterium]